MGVCVIIEHRNNILNSKIVEYVKDTAYIERHAKYVQE